MQSFLRLNDVIPYRTAIHLSSCVWKIVNTWSYFEKKTIGAQFVDAVDSISANIAEGFGRYHKKEKIHFYRYSQGSVFESLDWNYKAYNRGLVSIEQYEHIQTELKRLPREINGFIKLTKTNLSK